MTNNLMNSFGNMPPEQVLKLLLLEKRRRTTLVDQRLAASGLLKPRAVPSLLYERASKFVDLLHKKARYKVYWGGRGSGKSWQIAEALIRIAAKRKVRVLCVREFQNSIADSSHQILKDTIERLGLQGMFTVTATHITSANGSRFIFRGLTGSNAQSAGQTIKSLEGCDICWLEEAQTTSKESWNTLKNTIRKPGSEIWVSYNLINEDDPIHDFFVMNPPRDPTLLRDYCVHQVNFDANPYFQGTELWNEMLADKDRDDDLYQHVWLGGPLKISNAIIFGGRHKATGEPKTIVELFDDDLWMQAERVHLGADWGYSQDPSTLIRQFIVGDKLYVSHEAYQTNVELNEYEDFYKPVPGYNQWPIHADCSQPSYISHIRNTFGLNISGAEKWPGSVEDGIAHLKKFRQIVVHPRCKHTADELQRKYRWKVDRLTKEVLPIIVDKHNHCIAGGTLVLTELGSVPVELVTTNDRVMTRAGWQRVLWAGATDANRQVLEITTQSGKVLRCTPDHRVLVNGLWKTADAIRYNDEVVIVQDSPCSSSSSTTDCATPLTGKPATGATTQPGSGFMSRCGNIITGLFLKAMRFTTQTTSSVITESAISNASQHPSTEAVTGAKTMAHGWQQPAQTSQWPLKQPSSGTPARKDVSGTASTHRKSTPTGSQSRESAPTAHSRSMTGHGITEASAATPASQPRAASRVPTTCSGSVPVASSSLPASTANACLAVDHVASVRVMQETAPLVYDLTVEHCPEFFAGGVLVHNCVDAMRYGLDGHIQKSGDLGVWARLGMQT